MRRQRAVFAALCALYAICITHPMPAPRLLAGCLTACLPAATLHGFASAVPTSPTSTTPSPCTAAHPPQGSPASTTPLACRASRAHSRAVRRRTLAAPSLRLLARRSPCPALTAHRTVRNRSSPRRNIETADSQFLSKAFQTLWSAY